MNDTQRKKPLEIVTIDSDGKGVSIFSKAQYVLNDRAGMLLTEPLNAVNFRLRQSLQDYKSGWHVAGDPTLIIILSGSLRIVLRNGEYRDFAAGEMFVAKDRLEQGVEFDEARHGHRAEVIGDVPLTAVHIKLARLAG